MTLAQREGSRTHGCGLPMTAFNMCGTGEKDIELKLGA